MSQILGKPTGHSSVVLTGVFMSFIPVKRVESFFLLISLVSRDMFLFGTGLTLQQVLPFCDLCHAFNIYI